MFTEGPLTRRQFARIAAAGAGAAMLGCSEGILDPEKELLVTLSGRARYFDPSGKVAGTHDLAPAVVSGLITNRGLVEPDRVSHGVGTLRLPAPRVLAFAAGAALTPSVVHRTDRAEDGTIIETTIETMGKGVPGRRFVRIPSRGVELVDRFDYGSSGGLKVIQQRRIEALADRRLVVDITAAATGEIRLAPGRTLRMLVQGSPFLPQRLEAQQDCGIDLVIRFVGATLGVLAALSTCVPSGPICLLGLVSALIDWSECVGAMEACDKAI